MGAGAKLHGMGAMIKSTMRAAGSWWTLILVAIYLALEALPGNIWYHARLVTVASDSDLGLVITVDRRIRFDPEISYNVIVRQAAGLATVCEGPSPVFQYRSEAAKTNPTPSYSLADWLGPNSNCILPLPPGDYILETCWTVQRPLMVLRDKTVCIDSNVFTQE